MLKDQNITDVNLCSEAHQENRYSNCGIHSSATPVVLYFGNACECSVAEVELSENAEYHYVSQRIGEVGHQIVHTCIGIGQIQQAKRRSRVIEPHVVD